MSVLHHKSQSTTQPEPSKTRWLAVLEQELKRRVGWTNEAISPFGRRNRTARDKVRFRRAA